MTALSDACEALDVRARNAGAVHGEVNRADTLRLTWIGLEVDYEEVEQTARMYAGDVLRAIGVRGVSPGTAIAGLWAHGLTVGILLEQLRRERS